MSREKIIALARECGAYVYREGDSVFDSPEQLEAFYHKAQAEALDFMARDHIDEKTERLLNMAFEEGERRMAQKMCDLLGVTKC